MLSIKLVKFYNIVERDMNNALNLLSKKKVSSV